jgi:hypothetical protein
LKRIRTLTKKTKIENRIRKDKKRGRRRESLQPQIVGEGKKGLSHN